MRLPTCIFFIILSLFIGSCGAKQHSQDKKKIPAKNSTIKDVKAKKIWVAVAPYHEIDSCTTELICNQLEYFYGIKTLTLPRALMPDTLLAWSKTRYNANKILLHLSIVKPTHIPYILALTDEKIAACGDSTHETGVAGLGNRPGNCCVVSTATLHRKAIDEEQFTQRLIKACLHEMGHNFGLKHCKQKDKKCFMRDAGGTILTLDEETIHLCKVCTKILKDKGFDVFEES